jgi:hypothetical protein
VRDEGRGDSLRVGLAFGDPGPAPDYLGLEGGGESLWGVTLILLLMSQSYSAII